MTLEQPHSNILPKRRGVTARAAARVDMRNARFRERTSLLPDERGGGGICDGGARAIEHVEYSVQRLTADER